LANGSPQIVRQATVGLDAQIADGRNNFRTVDLSHTNPPFFSFFFKDRFWGDRKGRPSKWLTAKAQSCDFGFPVGAIHESPASPVNRQVVGATLAVVRGLSD
jgi:hypothetical protein